MKPFVRRSHLVVDVLDSDAVSASWTYNTDAVVLTMPSGAMERLSARANCQKPSPQPHWVGPRCLYKLVEPWCTRTSSPPPVPGSRA